MKKITSFLFIIFLSVVPAIASAAPAAVGVDPQYVKKYADTFINVINFYLLPALLALAFLVFLWGVFKQFIWKGESGEAHTEGAKFVASGIIGFVIILSLWALVNIARVTLGVGNTDTRPTTPIF